MQVPLNQSASVVLDSSGNGTAKVGPISAREVWSPSNVHVSASSAMEEATCKIYVGDDTTQRNYIAGTNSGSTGDASDDVSATTVRVGWYVWAVWANGDPGAVATLTVTGSKQI